MKTLDPAFQAHLESGNTTLCSALVLTLRDSGDVEGYTDNVEGLEVAGVECTTISTYTGKAFEVRQDYSVSDMELTASLDSLGIDGPEIASGKYDGAEFVLYLVNYGAAVLMGQVKVVPPEMYDIMHRGFIGDASVSSPAALIETRSLTQLLQGKTGETTSPICRADLGDERCGVDLAPFTVTGTIDSVTEDKTEFNDTARTEADNYFSYGVIRFTTGAANEGQSMEVKASTATGQITLAAPIRKPMATGDAYEMHRGCDRLPTTCLSVFNNRERMRAEIFLIGEDNLAKFGRQ